MSKKKPKEKNSFMMYHTWINQFNMLTPDEFVNMVNNLYRCDKGEEPVLRTQMEKVIWEGMGFVVEENISKWEDRAAASRANGAQGGAPKKLTPEQSEKLNVSLGSTNNLDNPVGYSDNLDNQTGFPNNQDNLLNANGQMLTDNGEVEMVNSKQEIVNGEMEMVNSKLVNANGKLVNAECDMLTDKERSDIEFDIMFNEKFNIQ